MEGGARSSVRALLGFIFEVVVGEMKSEVLSIVNEGAMAGSDGAKGFPRGWSKSPLLLVEGEVWMKVLD